MKLTARQFALPEKLRRDYPMARAFLAPQREHPAKVQHPKPKAAS